MKNTDYRATGNGPGAGLTEEAFLSAYRIEDYDRPSVTADVVVFSLNTEAPEDYKKTPSHNLSILLIRRGEHPYKDCWALPGGFLGKDETVEACAIREIREETNLEPETLLQVGVFSELDRDPRGRIVSNAFVSVVGETVGEIRGGEDAADAQWFDLEVAESGDSVSITLTGETQTLVAVLKRTATRFRPHQYEILDHGALAFDHAKIIATALDVLRQHSEDFELVFDFLPKKFTLASFQKIHEVIMGVTHTPANFRRKVAELVEETEEFTEAAGHRPARLFKRREQS